jgi:hypothetical protein
MLSGMSAGALLPGQRVSTMLPSGSGCSASFATTCFTAGVAPRARRAQNAVILPAAPSTRTTCVSLAVQTHEAREASKASLGSPSLTVIVLPSGVGTVSPGSPRPMKSYSQLTWSGRSFSRCAAAGFFIFMTQDAMLLLSSMRTSPIIWPCTQTPGIWQQFCLDCARRNNLFTDV